MHKGKVILTCNPEGFDASTIQKLFVDRNLEYANLIQAFSRTNRTFPNKEKGLVVTFRKPHTMEAHVASATKLYSEAKEESGLVYATYDESKKRFKQAYRKIKEFVIVPGEVDEHSSLTTRVDYVKAFQELNNAYGALVTYDEYNNDMEKSPALNEQVSILEEQVGIYETVKGSLVEADDRDPDNRADFSSIEFYGENSIKLYDIDAAYINRLLGTYSAHNQDIREEIEKALTKLNKSEAVKDIYREILNAMDEQTVSSNEDIFVVKRHFFTKAVDQAIQLFADNWFVLVAELHSSTMQYVVGAEPIPNIGAIIESKDFDGYKKQHPEARPFKYAQDMKRDWRVTLDEVIMPLNDELR